MWMQKKTPASREAFIFFFFNKSREAWLIDGFTLFTKVNVEK